MKIKVIKTDIVRPGGITLEAFLDAHITNLNEGTVVVLASKIVSLCENRVVPREGTNKDDLIKRETEYYLPAADNPYGIALGIAHGHLVAAGGIDESNADNTYVLWPSNAQRSANAVREHLAATFGIKNLGVIITDSTTRPFQWGTTGISIAYSGFEPLKDYIGTPDLFGRTLKYHKNNIMNGLAAAAVVVMGEGAESTPLAIIEDADFVQFTGRNPTTQELADLHINLDEDVYSPILKNAPWQKGDLQG